MRSRKSGNVLHYPQLDTVLMVEEFIRNNSGEHKKRSLWESLPRKMMYQTFCVIFDYLLESNKIAVDKEGKIGWIWDPEGVKRYLARKDLAWKQNQKYNSGMTMSRKPILNLTAKNFKKNN